MIEDGIGNEPGGDARADDASIDPRVLRALRSAERSDPSFTARVMSAVHAESRARRATRHAPPLVGTGWWRRRTVSLSPLEGLAMAAGIAAFAVLGTMGSRQRVAPTEAAPTLAHSAPPETVHVVRFVFRDRDAHAVSLVGDFNGWVKEATPLVESGREGTWMVSVALPRGRHEYAFVVRRDGEERWAADPLTFPVRDEFGTESSVVTVGDGRRGNDPLSTS